jgi:hypothetical protein
MTTLIEWILIFAMAYNFYAVWTIMNILDGILKINVNMIEELERMNCDR